MVPWLNIFALAPDCMKYCMSKDTPEIYIDGIIYDPDTQTARIDKNKMAEVIQDKVPDEIIENGKFCIGQDDSKPNSCQFRFGFREMSSFGNDDSSSRKIKLVLEKEKRKFLCAALANRIFAFLPPADSFGCLKWIPIG